MVVVVTPQAVHVHRHPRSLGKARKTVRHHLARQLAQPLSLKTQLDDAIGTVGQIDDGAGEGFVEGRVGGAEAGETGGCAEGGGEGGTEGYADIFGGVMVVDYDIIVSMS